MGSLPWSASFRSSCFLDEIRWVNMGHWLRTLCVGEIFRLTGLLPLVGLSHCGELS